MSFYLTVEQGDHLAKIADEHGFADWHTIWDDPGNADLKKKRDPHTLLPGDKLFIPDKQPKSVSVTTGAPRRFMLKGKGIKLRVKLLDFVGKPLENASIQLTIDGQSGPTTTDGDGVVEVGLKPSAEQATLTAGGVDYVLKLGHLDPADERSGLIARLRNLGFYQEPDDQLDEEALTFAIQRFQLENKLTVDGQESPTLSAKLKEVHGC
jgi:Putative peptidoglycan binding domain